MEGRDDEQPRPPKPRGRGRELWVGAFVLVGLISGIIVVFTMTDPAMFRGRLIISTIVNDAGGIRKGDPVRMQGVVIGRVLGFKIDHTTDQVTMKLEIEGEYPVPKDSRLVLRSKSLFGEMVGDIIAGDSTEVLKGGEVIPGTLELGIMDANSELPRQAGDLMARGQKLLSDEMVTNVQTSSGELRALLAEMSKMATEQRRELAALSKSLRKSATSVEGAVGQPELKAAIKRTDAMSLRMDEATASLKRSSDSLEKVMARLEKGEGSLGKLMKDDALYKNLNEAAANTSKLMADIRKQPKRYVKLSLF